MTEHDPLTRPMVLDSRIALATAGCRRVRSVPVSWPGHLHLHLVGHLGPWREVPPDLLSSARCVVLDAGGFVACRSPDGWHPWPGGRLESGEDPRQAARREVWEETGHQVVDADLEPLGLLHYRHLGANPGIGPYPEFLQVVYVARSVGGPPAHQHWRDVDGWEREAHTIGWDQVGQLDLNIVQLAFLAQAHA